MRALIVIPAYNEEDSIVSVVESVVAAGYDYVVINDGSKDGTLRACREHGINVVDLPQNLGIGGAVQTGHLYAYHHDYDVDVQIDGDGQHDISYLPRLLEKIEEGYDLVIGSRFVEQTGGFQSTALRRFGISWLRGCIKRVSGLTITDATSGFRASGRRAIELFSRRYPTDYPEPESIVFAHNEGLEICEVPVVMRERQGGTSSIGVLSSVYYMIKVTLAILIEGMSKRGR
ncbi:MAG: glycosyltransferase family 2 protein [Olsenella sp.]|nr:glycosyltransferase family 2 protein [Olsenella sp.]